MAKVRTPPIYTTPQDAALAFYHAFEARDLDAMMATWADDEEIVCVHPGGPRLVGFDAIRNAWEQLFSGDVRLKFRIEQPIAIGRLQRFATDWALERGYPLRAHTHEQAGGKVAVVVLLSKARTNRSDASRYIRPLRPSSNAA